MKSLTQLFFLIFLFTLSGCQGPLQEVQIITEPAGATVTLDGENKGVSPLTLPSLKLKEYEISVSLEGYKTIQDKIVVKSDPQPLKFTLFLIPAEPQQDSSI